MTNPVWSHVLALNAWTLKKAHIISYQETSVQITNFYMQGKFLIMVEISNWSTK